MFASLHRLTWNNRKSVRTVQTKSEMVRTFVKHGLLETELNVAELDTGTMT